jgi:hypothetical protein
MLNFIKRVEVVKPKIKYDLNDPRIVPGSNIFRTPTIDTQSNVNTFDPTKTKK